MFALKHFLIWFYQTALIHPFYNFPHQIWLLEFNYFLVWFFKSLTVWFYFITLGYSNLIFFELYSIKLDWSNPSIFWFDLIWFFFKTLLLYFISSEVVTWIFIFFWFDFMLLGWPNLIIFEIELIKLECLNTWMQAFLNVILLSDLAVLFYFIKLGCLNASIFWFNLISLGCLNFTIFWFDLVRLGCLNSCIC